MPLAQSRIYLAVLFVGSFVLQTLLLLTSLLRGLIYVSDFTTLLMSAFAVHSAHFGSILGALFGPISEKRSKALFWSAFALGSIWILILASRTAYFTFAASDSVSSLSDDLVKIGGISSVLVGAALSYFFNKKS